MTTHIGILPTDVLYTLSQSLDGENASFWRLPHPRTGCPALFLPYISREGQQQRVLEVQAVSPTNGRSWFLQEQVIEDGKLLLFTPIDPAFLLIPILQFGCPNDDDQSKFYPQDDLFEQVLNRLEEAPVAQSDPLLQVNKTDVANFLKLECTRKALQHVCEVKDITSDMTVYRFSPVKVIEYAKLKVARIAIPLVFETCRALVQEVAKNDLMEDDAEDLLSAGRLRASCNLLAQYLPKNLHEQLLASYDFTALDEHVARRDAEREPLTTATNNKKKKLVKEGSTDSVGDKKRKRSNVSVGVEKLKKVNVEGMAKLSSFFKKA